MVGKLVLNGIVLVGIVFVKSEGEWDVLWENEVKLVGFLEVIGILNKL